MKITLISSLAIASVLGTILTGSSLVNAAPDLSDNTRTEDRLKSCAPKKNPCAGKTNPCAAKTNPCAGKTNPCAAKTTKHPKVYTENGVALDGQDVVAYFTQKKVVAGNKQFTHKWNGATWQFSNANHRDLFAQNPEKYAPQYGGYCAKAASDGNLATTVPTAWEVRDGKLYLNYSAEAQQEWFQDTPQKIARANQNWPKILNNDTLYR